MRLEFRGGFTAIVGPNNSGKSTALKSIYELRELFGALMGSLRPQNSYRTSVNFLGVTDNTELTNDTDPGRFQITLEVDTDAAAATFDAPLYLAKRLVLEYRVQTGSFHPISVFAIGANGGSVELNSQALESAQGNYGEFEIVYPNKLRIDFSAIKELSNTLGRCRYFPAFRNAINAGSANYYDLPVGTALIANWDSWKAGGVKANKIAIAEVEREIASLLGFRSIQINADQTNTSLDVIINNKPYKLYEVGSGISQLIITLAGAFISQPSYILIDEPELNLHPSLQLQFLSLLASRAGEGVTFATHSVGLARSVAESIYSVVRLPDQSSKMALLGERHPDFAEWLGELSYSNRIDLGCENILLIEGPTELLCFQELLRKYGKDHKFVLIQLGGSSLISEHIESHLVELKRLIDPNHIFAFIDSERISADAELDKQRQKFLTACEKQGVKAAISHRRATENYFDDASIQSVFGSTYKALEPYQTLKDAEKPWNKNQNWKIARNLSRDALGNTDLGQFLESI